MGDRTAAADDERSVNEERRRAALQRYGALRDEFFPEVPEISSEELLDRLAERARGEECPPLLVDCRSEEERQVSIYKGAIPLDEFERNLEKYKDRQVIAYCAIGRRSGLFLRDLLAKYPDMKTRNHAGSLVDWVHAGGPLVDEATGSATLRVHAHTTWVPYLPLGRHLEVYGGA